uniref:Apolipoprotein Bb, tandem duplicate 2 n=1 Tax=Denticeps clupeoides TaxID=299321 RepID=A0AAY4BB94_9TELE
DIWNIMASRFKSFQKYEYLYETESLNSLNGAINGPKASCKVEIEVPGTCSYIMRTTECTLSEVVDTDAGQNPVFGPAATSGAFKAAMEKNPLKFTVEGDRNIKLFPENGELINILNIKRGIISALAVPVKEEKNFKMPTIYGLCSTDYTVNVRQDIADVTITRDLSDCDQFWPIKDRTSPLALFTDMHYPLAQLIDSSQTCNYKLDNEKKHPVSGTCTEKHVFLPFSHEEKGIVNVGKQTLTLQGVAVYNERVFDHTLITKGFVDKSPIQDKKAPLAVLEELAGLSKTNDGHRRAHLAHKLVSLLRKMSVETLSSAVPEALQISPSLSYQALLQCGTPECSSAFMKALRTMQGYSLETDAVAYAMGLLPNVSPLLLSDMLEMAKFRQSKPILYSLSNVVKRLYKVEGTVTPEIKAVAEFILEQIGDCTGNEDHTYLTLKVVANMAEALGAASPALKSAVVKCVNQPSASSEVQLSAVQVFRLTSVPEEGREVLMQVILDSAAPLQKRIAAYLVLMKDPQSAELSQIFSALSAEEGQQAESFVISHLTNIQTSTSPETQELREKILDALQGNEIGPVMDLTKFSRNYKVGSLEGNMIFEGEGYLPKEVMLEMSLEAFGYDVDMFEFGIESKGLEPAVEALFGADGFFPDTVLKAVAYTSDRMPAMLNNAMKTCFSTPQMSQGIMNEFKDNINKLIKELKSNESPEAKMYLRLLGMELGYLTTKDIQEMASSALKLIDKPLSIFPTEFARKLLSSLDNEFFVHYIFMDNEFYLPTASGVPLRLALSGTFAPGIKGGLQFSRDKSQVELMPSAGIEFVTEMGAHLPDFVESGLEMHTNIYHESVLNAKMSITRNSLKLTMPALQRPMKLIGVTNTLVSVTTSGTKPIPSITEKIDVSKCTPFFSGVKYCTDLQYSDAFYNEDSPYFPLSGDSKFAIELHPTGQVSEYMATIDYKFEQNVDTLTLTLETEGNEKSEAKAALMFNRQMFTAAADLQIPDFDLELGLRLTPADAAARSKGTHSVQLDFVNNNIPEATLIVLTKVEGIKDAIMEVEARVPSLETDAKFSTHLHLEEKTLELESNIKFFEASSEQALTLKYDGEKLEAKVKSNVNTRTMRIRSMCDAIKPILEEVWSDEIPDLPQTLFFNFEADAEYQFSQNHYVLTVPLPLGGKSLRDFNFPQVLSTPNLDFPRLGMEIRSVDIHVPEIVFPQGVSLHLPLSGRAEVSTKVESNLYNLETEMSAGVDLVDTNSYSAKVDITGTGPIDALSFKTKGSALLASTPNDFLKAEVKTEFQHQLIEAHIDVAEVLNIDNKVHVKSSSNVQATSPLGMQLSLEHVGQFGANSQEISGDGKLSLRTEPLHGILTLDQSFEVFPFKLDGKVDSTLKIASDLMQAQNTFVADLNNGKLSVQSNTAAFEDTIVQTAEITFDDYQLIGKKDTKLIFLSTTMQSKAEVTAGVRGVTISVENSAEYTDDRILGLVMATLDGNGLTMNSDANLQFDQYRGTHKASLTLKKDGLKTSGTTSLKGLENVNLENTFSCALDASQLSFSVDSKGLCKGIKMGNTNTLTAKLSSVAFSTIAEAIIDKDIFYNHDVVIDMQPYTATVTVNNKISFETTSLENKAQFMAKPYKMDLTGSQIYADRWDEVKHVYEIKYADLTASAKWSTTGKLCGTTFNQNTELEVAGLAVRLNHGNQLNWMPLRFDTSIHATAVPFALTVNAITNGDGDLDWNGKHSSQMFSKFLLKAEPLAFVHSHECRISVSQKFENGASAETTLDNKIDTLFTPSEQRANLRVLSQLNRHGLNQTFSLYNSPKGLGFEMEGTVHTSLFNTVDDDNQDFTVSGFVKYDKSTESHIIQLPFLELFPAVLEQVKTTISDIVSSSANTEYFKYIIGNVAMMMYGIGLQIDQMKRNIPECTVLLDRLKEFMIALRKRIMSGNLPQMIKEDFAAFIEEYDIKGTFLSIIELIENFIKRIDLMKFKDSTSNFLYELEKEYAVKAKLECVIKDLKQMITTMDARKFIESLKKCFNSVKFQNLINELMELIPTEQIINLIDTVKALVAELDIVGKFNTVSGHMKAVLLKYDIPQKIEALFDKIGELLRNLKLCETVNVIFDILKSISLHVEKALLYLENSFNYLRGTDLRQIIQNLNARIDSLVKNVKSFNYNAFVDHANLKINEYTTKLNKLVEDLSIQQKVDACRDFVNYVVSAMSKILLELRSTKFADVVKTLKDITESVVLKDMRQLAMKLKTIVNELDLKIELLQYVKQIIMKFFAFIENFDINTFDLESYAEVLTNNYLPHLPVIELPQIILPEISFPAIPKLRMEHLLQIPLQIPDFKLPDIPSELMVPSFGKLYGEVRVKSPIYNLRTSADVENTASKNKESLFSPQFTIYLVSEGTSPSNNDWNFNIISTTRVAIPKMRRVLIAETLKLTHSVLTLQHQSSLTFYGLSVQGSAKTNVKASSKPYTGELVNMAFFAMERGVSASMDTTYNHDLNIPCIELSGRAKITQKLVVRQEGRKIMLSVETTETEKLTLYGDTKEATYKGKLEISTDLLSASLTYTANTESEDIKIKETLNAYTGLDQITFDGRFETESSYIKKSLLETSGDVNFKDFRAEMKLTHNTELVGHISGSLSNSINVLARPFYIVLDFKNKGSGKVILDETLPAKIDLLNDFSVTLNTDSQEMKTVVLARLNQHKYAHNITIYNNQEETAMRAVADGQSDLEFLTGPINIPEMDLIAFEIPAISFNFYEFTNLNHVLKDTKQAFDFDANMVSKKIGEPLIELGVITIPNVDNFIYDVSFKSSIFNLNGKAELSSGDDNLEFRISAISASEFDSLMAKLEGTSRLIVSDDQLKMDSDFSLKNVHIEGTHKSHLHLDDFPLKEDFVSWKSNAKVDLPIFTFEFNQQLFPETNVIFSQRVKSTFDIPVVRAVGNAKMEQTFKTGLDFDAKATIDGSLLQLATIKGAHQATVSLKNGSLRSALKTTGNANVNYGNVKIEFDVDRYHDMELLPLQVSNKFNYQIKNLIHVADFKTEGNYAGKLFLDWRIDSQDLHVEYDFAQTSPIGDFVLGEKAVVNMAEDTSKWTYDGKIGVPFYLITIEGACEGTEDSLKLNMKTSATSPFVILKYDIDCEYTVLTKSFFVMKDEGVSGSLSIPSTIVFRYQCLSKTSEDLDTRLFYVTASETGKEVDIVAIKADFNEEEPIMKATFNLKAPEEIISCLLKKVPAIKTSLTGFAEKNGLDVFLERSKRTFVETVDSTYRAIKQHDTQLSDLSVFFRNKISQYQKVIEAIVKEVITFLRETKLPLPEMKELTIPEICKMITDNVAAVLEELHKEIFIDQQAYLAPLLKSIQVSGPKGPIFIGELIFESVKEAFGDVIDILKNLKSIDVILEDLARALFEAVELAQEYVDSVNSDLLNIIAANINSLHAFFYEAVDSFVEFVDGILTIDAIEFISKLSLDIWKNIVQDFTEAFSDVLSDLGPESFIKLNDGRLEIEL